MKSKIMKYILTVSFAFLFCLLFAGGVGMKAEAADPAYTIHDAEDLAETAAIGPGSNTFKGQTIRLEEDIDMNDLQGTEYEGQVIRFCTADAPFAGTFDGNGHTIKNLKNEKSVLPDTDLGLFAWTDGATIKDLTLEDPVVDCAYRGGVVVGHAKNTTIENVRVHGGKLKIQPGNNIVSLITNVGFSGGAIAGSVENSTLYNCEVRGTEVVNNSTAGVAALGGEGLYMGGIVGSASNSVIEYCRVDDGRQINDETGDYEMVETTIRNEYDVAVGALGGKAVYAGGIAGEIKSGSKIIDSYSTADVYVYCGTYVSVGAGNVAYAGGVVAEMYGDSCTVTRCHYAGNIHTKQYNALLVIPIIENDKYISGVAQYSESKEDNHGIDSSFFQRSASKTTKKFYALNDEADADNYKALSDEEYRDRSFWIGEDYDLYGTTTRDATQGGSESGAAAADHVNRWVMDYTRGIPIHGNSVSAAIDFPGAGKVTIDGTELIKNSMEGYLADADCSVSTSDAYNFAIQGFDTYEGIGLTTETTPVKDQSGNDHTDAFKFIGWYLKRDNHDDSVSQIKSGYETLTGNYDGNNQVGTETKYTTGSSEKFPLEDNDLYIAHYQANVIFHDVNGNEIDNKYYNYQDPLPEVTAEAPEGCLFYGWTDKPADGGKGYTGISNDVLSGLISGGNIYQAGDLVEKPLKLYPIYTNYVSNIVTIMEGYEEEVTQYKRANVGITSTVVNKETGEIYIEVTGLDGDDDNQKIYDPSTDEPILKDGYRFLGWYDENGHRVSKEMRYDLTGVDLSVVHTYTARLEYRVDYKVNYEYEGTGWSDYTSLWKKYKEAFDDIKADFAHRDKVDHWSVNQDHSEDASGNCIGWCTSATEVIDKMTVFGHNGGYDTGQYHITVTGDFPGAGYPSVTGYTSFDFDANLVEGKGYNFVGWGYEENDFGSYKNATWIEEASFTSILAAGNSFKFYYEAHYTADVNFHVPDVNLGDSKTPTTRQYLENVFLAGDIIHGYKSPGGTTTWENKTTSAKSPEAPKRDGYYFLGWIDKSDPEVKNAEDYIFGTEGDGFTAVSASRAVPYLLDADAQVERPMEVYAVYVKADNIVTTTNIREAGVPEDSGVLLPEDPDYALEPDYTQTLGAGGSVTLTLTAYDDKDAVVDGQDTKYQLQYVEMITNPGTDSQIVERLNLSDGTQDGQAYAFVLENFDLGLPYKFIAYYEPLTVVYHLDDTEVDIDIRNSGELLGESPQPKYKEADIENGMYSFCGWTTEKPADDAHKYYLMSSVDKDIYLAAPSDVVEKSMELYPAYAPSNVTVISNIDEKLADADTVRYLTRNETSDAFMIHADETVTVGSDNYVFTGWELNGGAFSSEPEVVLSEIFDGATYKAIYEKGYTVTYHYWNTEANDGAGGYDVLTSVGVTDQDDPFVITDGDGNDALNDAHTNAFIGIMNTLQAGQTFDRWQWVDSASKVHDWDDFSKDKITSNMDLYPVIWQTKVYDSSEGTGQELSQTATVGGDPEVYVQADLKNSNEQKVSVYFAGVYSNDSLRVNVGKQSYDSNGAFTGVKDIPVDVYNEYRLEEVENPEYGEDNPTAPPTITEMQGDLLASDNTDKDGNAIFEFDGKLTITKKLESDVATDESFIFKVTKLDASGNEESTTDVIVEAGYTVTMSLPYGTYKVTEDAGWAWRYTPSYETETKNPDGDVSQQNAGVDAGDWDTDSGMIYINSYESTVTCTNTESNSKWFDSSSNIRNVFGKKPAGQNDQNNN